MIDIFWRVRHFKFSGLTQEAHKYLATNCAVAFFICLFMFIVYFVYLFFVYSFIRLFVFYWCIKPFVYFLFYLTCLSNFLIFFIYLVIYLFCYLFIFGYLFIHFFCYKNVLFFVIVVVACLFFISFWFSCARFVKILTNNWSLKHTTIKTRPKLKHKTERSFLSVLNRNKDPFTNWRHAPGIINKVYRMVKSGRALASLRAPCFKIRPRAILKT